MKKFALIAAALLAGGYFYSCIASAVFENTLLEHYPELDSNEVREVFEQFLTNAHKGMYGNKKDINVKKMWPLLDAIIHERTASS